MSPRRHGRRRPRRRIDTPPKTPSSAATPSSGPKKPASQAPAKPADPLIGKVVGRCRIESRIGFGRTSVVYRAHHEALDATVAIKILLKQSAANPELVEKFQREARAIAQIDNENVLKIYDVGTEGKLHYIVMELLEGEEVLDILTREGRMDVMDALRVTRQAANGLAAAHARDLVHRDVKPQNLILCEDGTVKVVDFGLAGVAADGQGRVGTPHFMAPETCKSGASTAQSDIYSLGITLYHLLTGQPPYAGKDVPTIMRAHIAAVPLRPERRRPGLPKEVADVVRELTVRDPAERPASVQVIEDLDRIGGADLKEKGTLRRRRSRMRSHIQSKRQGGPAPAVVAIVLVVGAIVALIAMNSGGDDSPSTPPRASTPTPPPIEPRPTPATPPPTTTQPQPVEPTPEPAPAAEDPEQKALEALFAAEQWARRHWTSQDDDQGVMDQYRNVATAHPGTEAARQAEQRIKDIRAARVHAHPDKQLAEGADIERAKVEWAEAKPQVEDLIERHLYLQAKQLVPAGVDDGRGTIGRELAFWRTFLGHLLLFQTGMGGWVPKLPERRRSLETAQGTGMVEKVSAQFLTVRIDDKPTQVRWTEVESEALATLAESAFQDAPPEYALYAMAYAYAHRLWDSFWAADYALDVDTDASPQQAWMIQQYKDRMEERQARPGR